MNLIVAVDQNWGIGRDNRLLFPIPADLKRFRALTTGHAILMGRKTLESFPNGPLPNRTNLVLSRNPSYQVEGAQVVASPQKALELAGPDGFVIGGESIYRLLLDVCDTAYVTKIEAAFPADAWFPNLDEDAAWRCTEESAPLEHKGVSFRYVTYHRIQPSPPQS